MTYIKEQYEKETYELAFLKCFETMWQGQLDTFIPENLFTALLNVFEEDLIKEILAAANSPKFKDILTKMTEKAVKELGAFGCPWFWVYDGKGNAKPFFGSDRFHFMWKHLDIPHQDTRLTSGNSKL